MDNRDGGLPSGHQWRAHGVPMGRNGEVGQAIAGEGGSSWLGVHAQVNFAPHPAPRAGPQVGGHEWSGRCPERASRGGAEDIPFLRQHGERRDEIGP
jgi:hypothetical protein